MMSSAQQRVESEQARKLPLRHRSTGGDRHAG